MGLVSSSQIFSYVRRYIHLDDALYSSVTAHKQLSELLPVIDRPSAGAFPRNSLCGATAKDAPDSLLTEPYDTPPPAYAPPSAPSTTPEHDFLKSLLPIIALGLAAIVPSLLLALVVLVLTLRARIEYIRQSRRRLAR